MSGTDIDTLAALEKVIGKAPAAIHLKVIDHLDIHALAWMAASPLMFAGFGGEGRIGVTLGGDRTPFAGGEGDGLNLRLDALDDPALAVPGHSFCGLFLTPGVGETLRVNGRVVEIADGLVRIRVEECFGHCAKALIRSDFWSAEPLVEAPDAEQDFVAVSRFMALATIDVDGNADLSPKGDPAGAMARLDADGLWFADRPGNRKIDSFRNIVAQPVVAAALLLPGSDRVAILNGRARLTTDEAARAHFTVRDKVPHLAAQIADLSIDVRPSGAIVRAGLWPATRRAEGIAPAKMFAAHVRLNRAKGLGARVTSALVSVPGLMEKSLEHDYKTRLY